MDEMVEILKNDVNTTNTFLLTFNGQNERLDEGIQQMVRIIDRGSVMTIWTPPPLSLYPYFVDSKNAFLRFKKPLRYHNIYGIGSVVTI